ncbi:MAG: MCE family protein, partial [Desulfobacterales bacterium]|nr:MCE family protein [Desulfobacterales bacterium]
GTILSGVYIAVDPGKEGRPLRTFKGLENPPVITTGLPGSRFILQSDKLGSMEAGSPVYFKQIKVGEVESYKLEEDGEAVNITVFIHAPHHEFVQKNTRFWNAGGLDIAVDADGLRVNMPSIVSLLVGGVAFDTPAGHGPSDPAEPGTVFPLYNNYQDSLMKIYEIEDQWVLNFEGSVRGLSSGASVEFKGIQIGQVLDINFQVNKDNMSFRIPVLIGLEPERMFNIGTMPTDLDKRQFMNSMVAKGLRAQLEIGNILTGQLFVDLDFHPDAKDRHIIWNDKYPELPTVQQPLEEILTIITKTLNNINGIPFSEIGNDIRTTLKNMDEALEQTRFLMKSLDSDSPINQEARRVLEELAAAARSIRLLTEYLERNPDSLIFGKGKGK